MIFGTYKDKLHKATNETVLTLYNFMSTLVRQRALQSFSAL